MLRFGLSGTNWTRKTTAISALLPQLAIPQLGESIAADDYVQEVTEGRRGLYWGPTGG